MAKCIFNKKHTIKGYRKCEITGQIMQKHCYCDYGKPPCKHFKESLFDRLWDWLEDKF